MKKLFKIGKICVNSDKKLMTKRRYMLKEKKKTHWCFNESLVGELLNSKRRNREQWQLY